MAFDEGCLVVAEVAQAHDGSLGIAHSYIDAAADAAAGAVKFQTHIASAESTPQEPWRVRFSPQDQTRYDYWRRMEFSHSQWSELRDHANQRNLVFISSPFSIEAVELLVDAGVDTLKVASGELGNIPMLRHMASTGLPVILSSGMSPWDELDRAVEIFSAAETDLTVLQCTSEYPCPPEMVGLNVIDELRARYGTPVGLSDHSGTIYAGLAAATKAIGVLEVHVTFSRQMFGPDVPASITMDELASLTAGVRFIEKALASPIDKNAEAEKLSTLRDTFTKSVVVARDLAPGTVLTEGDLRLKKPGTGIPAAEIGSVIGRRLRRQVRADELLALEDLSE
jgi:N-acetylneuraminate synthase